MKVREEEEMEMIERNMGTLTGYPIKRIDNKRDANTNRRRGDLLDYSSK